jgi:hypothetical protein
MYMVGFDLLPRSFKDANRAQHHYVGQSACDDLRISETLPDYRATPSVLSWANDHTSPSSCNLESFDEGRFVTSYLRRFRPIGFIPYDMAWRDLAVLLYATISDFVSKSGAKSVLFSNLPHQLYDEIFDYVCWEMGIKRYFLLNGLDGHSAHIYSLQYDFSLPDRAQDLFNHPVPVPESHRSDGKVDLDNLYYMNKPAGSKRQHLESLKKVVRFYRDFRLLAPPHIVRNQRAQQQQRVTAEQVSQIANCNRIATVFLHMQPEMTTNRMGRGWESNLKLLVDLQHVLPENWKILVKEHPNQVLGYGRSHYYLDYIAASDRINLINPDVPKDQLMDASDLLVTVSGTVVREALRIGTNCLVYGSYPMEKLTGIIERSEVQDNLEALMQTPEAIIEDYTAWEQKPNTYSWNRPSDATLWKDLDDYGQFVAQIVGFLGTLL